MTAPSGYPQVGPKALNLYRPGYLWEMVQDRDKMKRTFKEE